MSDLSVFLDYLYDGSEGYIYSPTKEPSSLETGDGEWRKKFFEWPNQREALQSHIETNGAVRDVYISPVIWKAPHLLTKDNFKESNVAYTEFDGNVPSDMGLWLPGLRVQSSQENNQHCYFKLDTPITDHALLEKTNRIITYNYEGDVSSWDTQQVLRPPGTKNFKYPDRPEVKLIYRGNEKLNPKIFDIPEPRKFEATVELGSLKKLDVVIATAAWDSDDYEFFSKDKMEVKTRSSALMRLGHICASMGLSVEDSYVILEDADTRWGKYVNRQDRVQRLTEIISKAHSSAAPSEQKLNLMTAAQLADADYSHIKWLVKNILLPGTYGIIYSAPGVGKTRLSVQLAGDLALGKPFIGHEVDRPCKVLFLSLEMGDFPLQMFTNDIWDKEDAYQMGENLVFLAEGSSLSLDKAADQEVVYGLIRKYKPDVVMIDSIQAAVSADVSSNVEIKEFFKFLKKCSKNFGCAFWLIHHARKAQAENKKPTGLADLYGSAFIGAEATSVFSLHTFSDAVTVMSQVKGRHSPDFEDLELQNHKARFALVGEEMIGATIIR